MMNKYTAKSDDMSSSMTDFEIAQGYIPGALGRIASLHGSYYHAHWDFGLYFESKVATELAAFLEGLAPERDGFWTASVNGGIEGSIAIDGSAASTQGAHLRWFIVSDALRGKGAGDQLIRTAMDFCRECGFPRVYLWTFGGLDAAKHLYEREGFVLTDQRRGTQWGTEVLEQRFEWSLDDTG